MEDLAFNRFLASPLFTIMSEKEGEEAREYAIHSALLASMSPALKRLVDGDMMEANEGRVNWEADNQTLALFCEFAYTGSYKVAQKSKGKTSTVIRKTPAEDEEMVDGKTKRSCTIAQESVEEDDEEDDDYEDESASETSSVHNEEHANPENIADDLNLTFTTFDAVEGPINKDFLSEACTAHARLLIFADYQGVETLVRLSSDSLIAHLQGMSGYSHHALTSLLISTPDFAECLEKIVADHIADHIVGLWAYEPLRKALEDRPPLMAKVMDRLVGRV